ncbi:hypothetical protein GTR04_6868 [Trichophyton interdigitale]|nr:hypothetical protein GY631_6182 [Trichophyton interdigitale]KAG5217288.1 hypothetical protein GY632_6701 [Trichophyton interdigitale]KAG8205745.1 hypothetical protein GTR04_6868 [Trichophyton interdigitale]
MLDSGPALSPSVEAETDTHAASPPRLKSAQVQDEYPFKTNLELERQLRGRDKSRNSYLELQRYIQSAVLPDRNRHYVDEDRARLSSNPAEKENDTPSTHKGLSNSRANERDSDQTSGNEHYVEPEKRAVWLPKQTKLPFDFFPDDISIDDNDDDTEESDRPNLHHSRFKNPFSQVRNYPTGGPPPRRTSLRTVVLSPALSPRQTAEDISSWSENEEDEDEEDDDSFSDQIRQMERRNQNMEEKYPVLAGPRIPTLQRSDAFWKITPPEGHNLFRSLVNGFISLPRALVSVEEDMIQTLQYPIKKEDLYFELGQRESEIQAIVASHCGLPSPDCVSVSNPTTGETWHHGRFNLCIPVYVANPGGEEPIPLAFKLPLPYMVGEEEFPGNAEEKLRTEAATHIWVSQNCPDIPLPKLYGFGLPGGLSYFKPECVTIWQRIKTYAYRFFHRLFIGNSDFSQYIPRNRTALLNHGYMLTERIMINDELRPLPDRLGMRHNDLQLHYEKFIQKSKTQNLYRSFAKAMMSLANIPQQRIGSWTIDNNGRLSLSNRPLFSRISRFENLGIPSGIPRDTTYNNTDSFYNDCIGIHDNRIDYQKNILPNEVEAFGTVSTIVFMRSILPQVMDTTLRHGPFVMQLGSMPVQNILVDKEWNIKQFIEVQSICSLPIELMLPPSWITGKDIDKLLSTEDDRLQICYRQFAHTLRHEEAKRPLLPNGRLHSDTLIDGLHSSKFWLLQALQSSGNPLHTFRRVKGYGDNYAGKGKPLAAAAFRPQIYDYLKYKIASYVDYRKDVQKLFNGEYGRVYDEEDLDYIRRRPIVPERK